MNNNDLVLLKQLLSQKREEIAPHFNDSDYFQIFASEQALKDHDLSYDEIECGIVDGGGDGGIDGVYLFINGTLIKEPIEATDYKRGVPIDLVFIQAKHSPSFTEGALEKLLSSTRDLLNLGIEVDSLSTVYKTDLREKIGLFRKCYLDLASKFPKLSVRYYYASLGQEVHPNVVRKVTPLEELIASQFSPVSFKFEFLDAGRLLTMARIAPSSAHQLRLAESPIATGDQGYLCLVSLRDYHSFISDDDGSLKERLFEGNVRDYQGKTEVNGAIRNTLATPGDEDFWWLNNGIAVICASASLSGKTLTVENPEVVNGLQTSREIYHVFSENSESSDDRNVLVRVLVPAREESRDRIIRATNSQTPIPIASLRATDTIHRNIEDYLSARGLFYDRRKNYYKNLGKPIDSIISISLLAQFVLACALHDPNNARARPSSLLKRDEDYGRIFDGSYPISIYFICTVLGRKIEAALRLPNCSVPRGHWNNIRYYALMLLGLRAVGTPKPSLIALSNVNVSLIIDAQCSACIADAWQHYSALGGNDQVAKGNELISVLLEQHAMRMIELNKLKNQE